MLGIPKHLFEVVESLLITRPAVRVCPGELKLTILELESCQLFFVIEYFVFQKIAVWFLPENLDGIPPDDNSVCHASSSLVACR